MLRTLFIYLSQAGWARRIVTGWGLAWRTASRFVAGEQLADAIRVVKELNSRNMLVTLDHLGENTSNTKEAGRATQDILHIFDAICDEDLRAGVSIKLTQVGLALDETLAAENLLKILQAANECHVFVRIDMEDSPWVDKTLKLFHEMRQVHKLENVGVVIQSYLYRSQVDVEALMDAGDRVRLCKGAYHEPPDVAFPKKKDVDANFDRLTEMLIDGAISHGSPVVSQDGHFPPIPAIATHDEKRIEYAQTYATRAGLPKEAIEFQMLHGIRRELQDALAAEGYPVRIYVPYGTEWYPYFMRRLAERPANLWFFISNLVRR